MINLQLNEEQFAVLYEFVWNLRLGDSNRYEMAMSELSEQIVKENLPELISRHNPQISVLASADGMRFEVSEAE